MTSALQPVDVTEIEREAYKRSLDEPRDLAAFLLDAVGQRRVAAALGLKDARPLKTWASGAAQVKEAAVETRLRALYRAVWMISQAYAPSTAAAWLESTSPYLQDRSPLLLLAASSDEAGTAGFLSAARALLEG